MSLVVNMPTAASGPCLHLADTALVASVGSSEPCARAIPDHLRRREPEPVDPDSVAAFADRDRADETGALLERWRIAGMIAALPREEARLLRLRFYEGLSQREIAERTGLPLGTVKMRMVQALDRLRVALDAEEPR